MAFPWHAPVVTYQSPCCTLQSPHTSTLALLPPQASLLPDTHFVPASTAHCAAHCALSPLFSPAFPPLLKTALDTSSVFLFFPLLWIFQVPLDTFLFLIHNKNIYLKGAAISVVSLLHLLKYSVVLFWEGGLATKSWMVWNLMYRPGWLWTCKNIPASASQCWDCSGAPSFLTWECLGVHTSWGSPGPPMVGR